MKSAIDILAGAVSQLSVTSPTNASAGAAFSVRVAATDAYGNESPDYAGTVHFTISVQGVAVPVDHTISSLDPGIHSFSFTSAITGPEVITVNDLANPFPREQH